MEKPIGICIYNKAHFDKPYYVRTTDLEEAVQLFTSEFGFGFDFAEMTIAYFYELPFGEYFISTDPFTYVPSEI